MSVCVSIARSSFIVDWPQNSVVIIRSLLKSDLFSDTIFHFNLCLHNNTYITKTTHNKKTKLRENLAQEPRQNILFVLVVYYFILEYSY